ncbi:MAG: head GIN domain-containing protein [Bacteroidota bacterium]
MRLLRIIFYTTVIGLIAVYKFGNFSSDSDQIDINIEIEEETQVIDLGDTPFSKIGVSGNVNVEIEQGDAYRLEIEHNGKRGISEQGLVQGGTLELQSSMDGVSLMSADIKVILPQLDRLDVAGVADVRSNGIFEQEEMELHLAGASDVHLEVQVEQLHTYLGGSADLDISGDAEEAKHRITGAGDLKARSLESEAVTIEISGAGDAKIHVNQSLDAKVWGSGDVQYTGNPNEVSQQVSGVGTIERR